MHDKRVQSVHFQLQKAKGSGNLLSPATRFLAIRTLAARFTSYPLLSCLTALPPPAARPNCAAPALLPAHTTYTR